MLPLYNKRSLFVLAATLLVAGFLYVQLGYFSKFMMERYASEVLGTSVSIGYMNIDAINNKTVMRNIEVENPMVYRNKAINALTVKEVAIDTDALLTGIIVFSEVKISGVDVYLVADSRTSNFAMFRDNVIKHRENFWKTYNDNDRSPPDIAIKHLQLVDAKLYPIVDDAKTKLDPVSVPNFEMQDIGTRESGVRTGWAIATVWQKLTNEVIDASADSGLLSSLPAFQMSRVYDTTNLPEEIPTEMLKGLFGRRF